jgi:hypothetical protein
MTNRSRPARHARQTRGTAEWIDEQGGRLAAVHKRAQLSLDAEIGADILFPLDRVDDDAITLF